MAKEKVVYTIVNGTGERKFWLRVGTAFMNRDGSLNVKLDAMPVNGTLHIRDPEAPREVPADPRRDPDAA